MSTPSLCIHGHFYQPPRENPWTGEIERQPAAAPYHDWNERITAECYAPNTAARVLDEQGRIVRLVNTYARISFDFGPTLLSWLQRHAPETYAGVLDADHESRRRFGGHGSALAQGYHHAILPLCNARDRRTEIRWGLADFAHRFGRRAAGLWLPECAVDTPTLEDLAAEGLAFTVLSPRQAATPFDPSQPCRVGLPSGRSIAVFFYDGPLSQAVAFEGLLASGDGFYERLAAPGAGLRLLATDGESYGHHAAHGDMALAWALHRCEQQGEPRLTNMAEHLARHPVRQEVAILESSSWSCAHGVERWRADCGCHVGGGPAWTQAWRAPLRAALELLRDELATLFEREAGKHLPDPWAARDAYVQLLLDVEARDAFRAKHGERALGLLEMQRHALLMFTSCGWFFDDLANIETVQVLQYAARAIELARELCGVDLEERFLERLSAARSNRPEVGGAREVWRDLVLPARERARAPASPAVPDELVELLATWEARPDDLAPLAEAAALGEGDVWRAQNVAWRVVQRTWPARTVAAQRGDAEAAAWLARTRELLLRLSIAAP